ncbi:hypothetical protein HPHPH44_1250 [Helicobacter pylori Hp H-44]|nr:hypothetical protein HPHPH44_1250 [Helicobacter pylori Hp H-44]
MKKLEINNAQRDFFKKIKSEYSPFHHLLKLRHLKWRHLKTKCDFKLICFKNSIKTKNRTLSSSVFFFFLIK